MNDLILLSRSGSDRATAYQGSNKIIRHGDRLYVGWLDAPEVDGGLTRIQLGVCDSRDGRLLGSFVLGKGIDNHCGPALAMDSTGRLHVIVGAHGFPGQSDFKGGRSGDFLYRWSDDPSSPESWSPPVSLGPYDTYPSLVVDAADTLHLVSRESGEHPRKLIYRRKFSGRDWEAPTAIALCPKPGYTAFMHGLSVGPDGRLHLTFQHLYSVAGETPGDVDARLAAYLVSDDGGDSWVEDGHVVQLPLTLETTKGFFKAPEGGIRLSNHVVDAKGRLWIFSSHPEKAGGILFRKDEAGWREIDTSKSLGRLNNQEGREISISRDVDGRIHLVMGTVPAGQSATWKDPHHELFHLVLDEEGRELAFGQLTETDPKFAHWLPSVENWNGVHPAESGTPWMLFTQEKETPGRSEILTDVFLARLPAPAGDTISISDDSLTPITKKTKP